METSVNDSPEKISKCLNCEQPYCNNCLSNQNGKKRMKREVFLQLYDLGYSDQKIAHTLGVGKSQVINFRRWLRLKMNKG